MNANTKTIYFKSEREYQVAEDFECFMCGECCRSGYDVYINREDVEKWMILEKREILDYLIIKSKYHAVNDFVPVVIPKSFNTILKGLEQGLEYIIKPDFYGNCPFLTESKCEINSYKPIACKRYPFTIDLCLRKEGTVL